MFCDSSHLLLAIAAQRGAVAADLLATAGWVAGPELWGGGAHSGSSSGAAPPLSRRALLEAEADALAAASSALTVADVDMAPDARAVLMAATAASRASGFASVGSAAALLALLEAADEARARERALLRRERGASELWGKQSPRTAAAQRALAQEEEARRRRGDDPLPDDDDGGGDLDDDDATSAAARAARAVLRAERLLAVAPATLEALGGAAVVAGGPRVDWRALKGRCAAEPPEGLEAGAPAPRERSLDEWVAEMRAAEEQARARAAAGAGAGAGAAATPPPPKQQQQQQQKQAPPPPPPAPQQQQQPREELDMNALSPEDDEIYN